MSTYVLIHGASHDGAAFEAVVSRLADLGHDAYAPTVAGHGKGAQKQVSLAQAVGSVVDYIIGRDLADIVLLGHSVGGTLVAKVAEKIPDRIRRLVFWSAIVPDAGECVMDVWPPEARRMLDGLAEESSDNTVTMPFPLFRDTFVNDADLETAQWVYSQLSAQPYGMLTEPVDLTAFHALPIPRSWLMGTEDIALPPGQWGWHPRLSSRLGVYRLVQMPGGHELMYTNPIGLADKIIEAGRD
ncbi:alpha/beta hydrolase [Mycobacterium sp. 236(2023)]|uniref:alpha/beta fold hydrolase n=1 Tax=Mycobacterium sp. 236(2023) TaxID=3038163 RepID=UPI002414E90D|nr:alpha/beta hydrolase [Mycobacterium sp. 236(2023)]MDG4665601.1 alpha/beta hydrolase [Mycobacterium sp. 236(2023)]